MIEPGPTYDMTIDEGYCTDIEQHDCRDDYYEDAIESDIHHKVITAEQKECVDVPGKLVKIVSKKLMTMFPKFIKEVDTEWSLSQYDIFVHQLYKEFESYLEESK